MYTLGALFFLLILVIIFVCLFYFGLRNLNFSKIKLMLLGIGILGFLDVSLRDMISVVLYNMLSILGFSLVIVGFISKEKI